MTLLPTVILGPFVGSLVDRWKRRTTMIVADSAIAILSLLLIVLFRIGSVEVWLILTVNFLRALGGTFHQPAMLAATTLLVPPDHLTRVGGMNRTLNGMLRIIVPPAGALLIMVTSFEIVLLIDAVTAGIAVGTLMFLKIPQPVRQQPTAHKPSVLRETLEGIRYVRYNKSLFFVVMTCTLANVFLGPALAFKPLLITSIFQGGAVELSFMSSLTGIGLIIGGLIISMWGGFRRRLITSGLGGRIPLRFWFLMVGLSHAVLGISWMFSRRIREAEEVSELVSNSLLDAQNDVQPSSSIR